MFADYESTVRIPVRIHKNGTVTLLYKNIRLALISNETVGELIIPSSSLVDPQWAYLFNQTISQQIFPAEAVLYYKIRTNRMKWPTDLSETLRDHLLELECEPPYGQALFAQIVLKSPLKILTVGTKKPRLHGCDCYIPALKRHAISINQAGRFLSEAYENRQSQTINAFRDVYTLNAQKLAIPLKTIQDIVEAEYEKTLHEHLDPTTQTGLKPESGQLTFQFQE